MLIDRKSRPWIIGCLAVFLVATALYIPYARRAPHGPRGGSWPGIFYAIAGSAMIAIAMLLSLRKRVRTMRIGRAHQWMQGHVWLGLLSYPLILYHAGFAFGGPLTSVLMWLFTGVIVSGVVGLAFQQVIPTRMLRDVPDETIYEQIGHVLGQLRDEALALVESSVARKEQEAFELEVVPAGAAAAATAPLRARAEGDQLLRAFYRAEVAPVLADRMPRRARLATGASAAAEFRRLHDLVPVELRSVVNDLAAIVNERRQLARQRRMHLVLHGWLLVHVPLSYAMVILAVVHAVGAMRYAALGT